MMEKETLEQKTLMELRTMAKEMGLGPISALKKGDLIARIKEKQSQSSIRVAGGEDGRFFPAWSDFGCCFSWYLWRASSSL